jgi:YD repeat-containing protein
MREMEYDPLNRLTSIKNEVGYFEYFYNDLGRLQSVEVSVRLNETGFGTGWIDTVTVATPTIPAATAPA